LATLCQLTIPIMQLYPWISPRLLEPGLVCIAF
jgi:hypothetical protein